MSVFKYKDNCCDNSCAPVDDEKVQALKVLLLRTQLAKSGEIVVSTKEKSIIGTTALDTCWGIMFYDRKIKWEW